MWRPSMSRCCSTPLGPPRTAGRLALGIAYSPGNSGTTSIRAGFGMAYDVLYDNIGSLAVPPQVGSTIDVPSVVKLTPNFFAGGGIAGWRQRNQRSG